MKKQRFVQAGIALLAAIFALGFIGCDSGGGGVTPPPDDTQDATVVSVTFGNDEAEIGTPASTYSGITNPGSTVLLDAESTVTVTPTVNGVDVRLHLLHPGEEFDAEDLWYDTDFTFATGDILVIRVTAKDETTELFYKIVVTLANVALEDSLTVGGLDVALPTPATTWENAEPGSVLFQTTVYDQGEGTEVAATAKVEGSTITYGHAQGNAEPTFSDVSTIRFLDGEYLYIKVTSGDGTSAIYKIQVNFKQAGIIKYGSPEIKSDAEKYIDPLWDSVLETYIINKRVTSDPWRPPDGVMTTSGVGKAMWDENGLYIYVAVTDDDVSTVPKTGSEAHETDSVELFVNEGLPSKSYSNGGSQYRVGANGERSGEGDSPAALEKLNKTSAWKTDTGYIVIFQAPWRLRSRFFGDDTYKNDWKIGFELQINAAPEVGQRYGTLVWNNTAHTNYQNANNYGEALLKEAPPTLTFPPVEPRIISNPIGRQYAEGDTVRLKVEAAKPPRDTGTLSYQWYKSDSATAAGSAISGATEASYSFTAAPAEETYYYAAVKNTLGGASETTNSARAKVRVGSMADSYYEFDPPLKNETPIPSANQPVHTIDLEEIFGAGFDGSLYEKLTVDIHWYDSTGAEVTAPKWSLATLEFKDDSETNLTNQTNYGQSMAITEGSIPPAAQKDTLRYVRFLSADASAATGTVGSNNYYDVRYIEIRSIIFHLKKILMVQETFTLDLANRAASETINSIPVAPGSGGSGGAPLTLTYNTENQIAAFVLSPEQIAKVNASGIAAIRVTIEGSASVDVNVRYCLGKTTADNWNGTSLAVAKISTYLGAENTKDWDFTTNKSNILTLGHFILQLREATATELTINSITISTLK